MLIDGSRKNTLTFFMAFLIIYSLTLVLYSANIYFSSFYMVGIAVFMLFFPLNSVLSIFAFLNLASLFTRVYGRKKALIVFMVVFILSMLSQVYLISIYESLSMEIDGLIDSNGVTTDELQFENLENLHAIVGMLAFTTGLYFVIPSLISCIWLLIAKNDRSGQLKIIDGEIRTMLVYLLISGVSIIILLSKFKEFEMYSGIWIFIVPYCYFLAFVSSALLFLNLSEYLSERYRTSLVSYFFVSLLVLTFFIGFIQTTLLPSYYLLTTVYAISLILIVSYILGMGWAAGKGISSRSGGGSDHSGGLKSSALGHNGDSGDIVFISFLDGFVLTSFLVTVVIFMIPSSIDLLFLTPYTCYSIIIVFFSLFIISILFERSIFRGGDSR